MSLAREGISIRSATEQQPRLVHEFRNHSRLEFLLIYVVFLAASAPFYLQIATASSQVIEGSPFYFYYHVLIGLLSAIYLVSTNTLVSTVRKSNAYPLLFFVLFLASSAWTDDSYISIRSSVDFLAILLFAYFLNARYSGRQIACLFLHVLGIALVLSLVWVFLYPDFAVHTEVGDIVQDGHGGDWRGIYAHKNYLGGVAGLELPLLWWYGRQHIESQFILRLYQAVSLICLVKAHSGAGFLLPVFCVAIIICFAQSSNRQRLVFFTLAVASAIVMAALGDHALDDIFGLIGKDATLTGRTYLWDVAWEMFLEHPWFGHGYPTLSNAAIVDIFRAANHADNAHSAYLQVLIESGLAGAAIWFLVLGRSLKNVFFGQPDHRQHPEINLLATAVLGISFIGFAEVTPMDTRQSLLGLLYIVAVISLPACGAGSRSPATRRDARYRHDISHDAGSASRGASPAALKRWMIRKSRQGIVE